MPLRILLADDAPAVRQGVRGLLEREGFEVVGEAPDGREAVRLAQEVRPDVAILDLSMPRLDGVDAAREIRQVCPWTHLILLTVHSEEHQIVRAFLVGIRGYVVKTHAAEDLARAIEEVSNGGIFLSDSVSHVLVESYLPQPSCPLPLDRPGATCGICGFRPCTARDAAGRTPKG
jgi:two-component system response regulator NreC